MKPVHLIENKKVKISHWDDEVNLELEAEDLTDDVHIYDILNGLEIETRLASKPNKNEFKFKLKSKGLKFYYQPPLTQEEIGKMFWEKKNRA